MSSAAVVIDALRVNSVRVNSATLKQNIISAKVNQILLQPFKIVESFLDKLGSYVVFFFFFFFFF